MKTRTHPELEAPCPEGGVSTKEPPDQRRGDCLTQQVEVCHEPILVLQGGRSHHDLLYTATSDEMYRLRTDSKISVYLLSTCFSWPLVGTISQLREPGGSVCRCRAHGVCVSCVCVCVCACVCTCVHACVCACVRVR